MPVRKTIETTDDPTQANEPDRNQSRSRGHGERGGRGMSRKQALAELIAKVEAGEWPGTNILHKIDDSYGFNAWRAFEGSLDAAKALHEAVLGDGYVSDGYKWCIWGSGTVSVWDVISGAQSAANVSEPSLHAASPARAWLLSILKALHSMEDN